MNEIWYIVLTPFSYIMTVFVLNFLRSRRAYKSNPTHYKKSFMVDKNNTFIGTITPVYRDHKTGCEYLGKTEVIK